MTDDLLSRLTAALGDRYTIERPLGEGGMATVYLARDLKHERDVAIKVLKPELAAVIGGERFVSEIKTTAALQHPNILPLFDSGEADGFLYYVMPYVEGESLREKLDREKQFAVDEAVKIATAVASALHAAHTQGVVHRGRPHADPDRGAAHRVGPLEAGRAPDPAAVWTGTRERPWTLFPWAWSEDDWIYGGLIRTDLGRTGIGRVRGSGGEIESLLELPWRGTPDGSRSRVLQVQNVTLLPGDRTLLFDYGPVTGLDDVRILSVDVASGDTTTVVRGWNPQWSPSGHLVFARESLLYVAPFDPTTAEMTGAPVPLGIDLEAQNRWPRHFHLAREGPFAYLAGIADWSDAYRISLIGENEEEALPLGQVGWLAGSLSPGGDTLAYVGAADVLVQDLSVGSVRRIPVEGIGSSNVVWSPNGGELAIGSTEQPGLLIQDLAEEAPPRRIEVEGFVNPTDWLDDGRIVAEWRESATAENVDLVLVDPEDGSTESLLDGDWIERGGQVSADGRWIGYQSYRSEEGHFYVRSFPDLGSELRLSRDGSTGVVPGVRRGVHWAPDGLAAHFIEGDAVVRVRLGNVDGALEILQREQVTSAGLWDQLNGVHPDGRILLGRITTAGGAVELPRLHIVTDMVSELRRRAGGGG